MSIDRGGLVASEGAGLDQLHWIAWASSFRWRSPIDDSRSEPRTLHVVAHEEKDLQSQQRRMAAPHELVALVAVTENLSTPGGSVTVYSEHAPDPDGRVLPVRTTTGKAKLR